MVKPLLLVALVANIFLFVSSTGCQKPTTPCKPPQKTCRLNEVWSNCPIAVCRPKTCADVGFPVTCLDLQPDGQCPVKPGCICKEGYVRNSRDSCIPLKNCSSCGGDPNAVSGCGNHYNNLCSNYSSNPGKCETDCLYNGCDCRPGFVFDEIMGKCVYPSECSRMFCKKNEVYDPCPAPCPYRTCGINDAAVSCAPALDPGNHNCAPPNCRCKDGYYRNDVGKCVLWKNCPVCQGLNEVYDPCPPPCPPQRCDVNIALILCAVPPQLGDPECEPGCRCIDNYARNETGVCIPRDECPICPNANEVYDPCIAPCPARRCDVDDRLIKCAAPPKIGDPSCKAGCRCADGYYRNSLGCVTREECPACYGPHEYYACGGACDNVCATLHEQNQTNCPIVNIKCNDMCYCEKGYARDDNNTCIPIENCIPPKCTGKHEVYSNCIQGQCNPKNCSQLGFPVACPRIDPQYCIEGCLCKEGYVKDENNVCIPATECPSCGGDSNAVAGCGNCNKRCSDIGKEPVYCIQICYENACDCKEGLYYDDNTEKCVLPEQCTPTCGPDEVYDECVQGHCNPKNCSQLGFPVACPKIDAKYCKKGCLCKQGYLRNDKGVCIPMQQCPSCGGDPNAESGCGNHCGNQCSDYTKKNLACPLGCQLYGCKCRKGYVYDSNTKKCVLPKDCTVACNKPNEYYEPCDYGCPPQTCESLDKAYACPIREGDTCKGRCKCKSGYYRNKLGNCITEAQCRQCKGPHEYFSCGGACDNVCSTLDKQNQTNCPIINIKCNDMCYCEKDYARAKNGTCIPIKQCKEPQCDMYERYEEYPARLSGPQKCSELGYPKPCPKPANCKHPVKPACVCVDGYVRNSTGKCIPKKECPSCGGDPNAQSGCGINCGKKCEDFGKEPGGCITLCKDNACDCKDGYYYDKKQKKCVLPSECTDICSGEHEIYENCTNPSYDPKKCSQVGFPVNYTNPPACTKGCICNQGYVRNDTTGNCIPIKQCPSCGGDPNAHSGCGINCGKKCEDIGKKPGACILLCKLNACDCNDGYYYDKQQNKCVLPSQCTKICTGKHEIYENCTNPTCRPQKCSEVGFSLNCTDPPTCTKGCICEEGYVRNDTSGICIPIKQCPSCGGDKNAESGCGVNCLKKCYDLQNPSSPRPCLKICKINSCDCKEGFYYDENTKTCVCADDCTPTCGTDEIFDPCVNDGCTVRNCSQLNSKPKPKIDKKYCKPGCTCKEGYLRSDKGICIPMEECPNAKCGKHEKIALCPAATCLQRCNQLGYPLDCPTIEDGCCPGRPGCICEDGYVRNKNGKCIPMRECPSCGGDPNAWSGCGVNCGKKCEDLVRKNYICPRICNVNSCDCKDDFYYDKNIERCVTADSCSPICGEDEVYDACINGGCGHRNCSQINKPVLCIDPLECIPGCTCKEGYLRIDDTGVCVPEDKCPKICNKINEVYVKCPPICPPQTCKSLNETFHCPLIKVKINESDCVGECRCKEGYYRNLIDECISERDCLKCKGAHEYFSCGPACGNVCCDFDTQNKENRPIKNKKCVPRCYCENGYARNQDGVCVSVEECPGGTYEPSAT